MIIAYESGELGEAEQVEMFQRLVDSGMIASLQGHYGRMAWELMRAGVIVPPMSRSIN